MASAQSFVKKIRFKVNSSGSYSKVYKIQNINTFLLIQVLAKAVAYWELLLIGIVRVSAKTTWKLLLYLIWKVLVIAT